MTGYFSVDLNEPVHKRCHHDTQMENKSDIYELFAKILHVSLYFMRVIRKRRSVVPCML